MKNLGIVLLVLLGFSCAEKEVQLTNYKQWHTIILPFEGPDTSELSENYPFLNYRLIVEFSNGEEQFNVQGFYAADGNASETSADSGNIWQARFTPNTLGKWTYKAQMDKTPPFKIDNCVQKCVFDIYRQNNLGKERMPY